MTSTSLDTWKNWAIADAERRGLHGLKPILEALAVSTARLRATAWQPAADLPQPLHSPEPDTHGR
jgi:hypothetical protein